MRKRYQDYYEAEVARECGLNAAAVATFLWRRLIHDPNMKYSFKEIMDICKGSKALAISEMNLFTEGCD